MTPPTRSWPADSATHIATAPACSPYVRAQVGILDASGAFVWHDVESSGGSLAVGERSWPIGNVTGLMIHQPTAAVAAALDSPLNKTALRLFAGYQRPDLAAGTTTDALVFTGVLQASEYTLQAGDTTDTTTAAGITWMTDWATFDTLLDVAHIEADWTPPSPALLDSLTATLSGYGSLRNLCALLVDLTFTTTGYQFVAWSDYPTMVLRTGDRLLDYLVMVAEAFGLRLWVNPAAPVDQWRVDVVFVPRTEYDAGTAWAPVWYTYNRQADLSEAGTVLRVTASSAGVSTSGTFTGPDDFPFQVGVSQVGIGRLSTIPPTSRSAVRLVELSASYRAAPWVTSDGTLSPSWPLIGRGLAAARVRDRRHIITTRAAWWLHPRDSVTLDTLPGVTVTGVVSDLTITLDDALMTTTIRPT